MRQWMRAVSLAWRRPVQELSKRMCSSLSDKDDLDLSNMADDLVEEYFDESEVVIPSGEDPKELFRKSIPIPLTRGKRGVFEVEELTTLLRHEGVSDICVLKVPEEARFVDYMVIGSCKNERQNRSIAEVVRRVYKEKRYDSDPVPDKHDWRKTSSEWISVDYGNIIAHLFLPEVREFYDIESLWACGEKFDSKSSEAVSRKDQWDVFDWEKLAKEMEALRKS